MKTALTGKQKQFLKGLAHPLSPIVRVGKGGVTQSVVEETKKSLHAHELIKVRLPGLDREERDSALHSLARRTESTMVTRIGHVAVLYKTHPKLPRIVLPG